MPLCAMALRCFRRISQQQRKAIAQWGIQNGYAENVSVWRVTWYDSEMGEERYSDFESEQEAQEEAAETGGKGRQVHNELAGTAKLQQRANHPGAGSTVIAFDLLVTVYAEDVLECDGVWWADTLDPANLSAPRGVIFQSKLPSWAKKKVQVSEKQASSNRVSSAFVAQYVQETHEGFEDLDRIWDHDWWQLADWSYLDHYPVAQWMESKNDPDGSPKNWYAHYAREYAALPTPIPPIVVDHNDEIIDGYHRIGAAFVRGERTIKAYVPMPAESK